MICRQCLHRQLQCAMTELVILWSQCSLPVQHCGVSHQGPTRANQDLDALHHEQVEENDTDMPMALYHEAWQRRCQRDTKKGQGTVANGESHGCTSDTKVATFPHIQMPHICSG